MPVRVEEMKNLNQKLHFSERISQKHLLEKNESDLHFDVFFLKPYFFSAFLPENGQKRGIFGG